ncbi:MAG: PAS domain S-box protein [Bacteroidota bacterium]|nr:PAS domain S-box protein [Bacteroidota bacterium]
MIGTAKGSSEPKNKVKTRRNSNEQFRAFFEKTRNPILVIDDSFHFTDCNEAAVKILGADSKDQVLNKPPAYFSPEYQPDGQLSVIKAKNMIKSAYKKGQLQFEWIHKRLDGVNIYMDVNLTVIPVGAEKVLLVQWRDITESKKSGETIHKLYQAIEQTNEIVFMTDIDGTINFVNAAFEEVYGYKKKDVLGKATPRILKSGVMDKEFYKYLWERLPAGRGIRKEIINKTKDGRLINIHTSLSPIFNDKKILIGYMAVQEDITKKKIAEKKLLDAELQYRTLFKQSPDGICLIDFKTLLPLDFNAKAHKQLGYSREEFSKSKISDYEIIETPKATKARAKKIINEGHDDFITRHKTKNGEIRDVHVIVQKILLHENPVFYAIYRDITDEVRLANTLKIQEKNLQRQIMEATLFGHEEEKNELGRELHDNVNQLLATAKIYLGIVKSKKDSIDTDLVEKCYDYVTDSIEEIRKLSHSLVSSTLKEIGLQKSLKELVQELNLSHGLKVKLIYNLSIARIPDKRMELMIFRIVQEQVNNIRKHAQAKTIIIHLREKDDHLELSVADDGVGFDTAKKGNGIGLRNIQSRAEIYSGSMNIISSPGEGCQLDVRIPL